VRTPTLGRVRGVNRLDAVVALGFVLAAVADATVRHRATPGLLAFDAAGALWLASLAVRRTRPLVPISLITAAGVVGAVVSGLVWPKAPDDAGVWILALMLASYSLGAHGAGRPVVLGLLLPLTVAVTADATTRIGWDRINGIMFVTVFVGVLPTAVGRVVRVRHERLRTLRDQRTRIEQGLSAQRESVVLAERLRATERLQPTLLEGLHRLAARAESAGDPGEIETAARVLLSRTREEVVSLATPVEELEDVEPPVADHVRALRSASERWAAFAAGAVTAGLSLESSHLLEPSAPGWVVVPASLAVGAPLALAWWRPVTAVTLAWIAAAAYSRLLAPLDGSLSETGFALGAAFAVAALSRRRTAVVGLVVCWLGQVVGVGTDDPVGAVALLCLCWLGGLAVNEVSRLVEQTRANHELLARQEAAAALRAVVEERLRLARELHDALGHSLTVVALQAGAARRLVGREPVRARALMGTVATVARSGVAALTMTDRADIAGVVERVRGTGLTVDADVADEALLDTSQRIIACRVVQEGLTNVLRHAPGSRARVLVRCGEGGAEVVVANSAPVGAGAGLGSGRGLAGIRERVVAGAGRVTWQPCPDGGFEVRALLPSQAPPLASP
jgi:signal transduction histidine kinase